MTAKASQQAENPIVNRLAEHRRAARISQFDLAARSGVSRETISNTERGISLPAVDIALRLAKALDVRVEDLFDLESSVTPPSIPRRAPRGASVSDRLDRIEQMLTQLIESQVNPPPNRRSHTHE